MTTFNTGNPIGSTDARDRSDNSENLDLAVNSLSQTFVDRLGVTRDTLEGVYQKSAYYRAGTFDAGYTLTNNRQTLAYGNIEYSWSGPFGENGKQVPPLSTPETTGGVGAGAWVDRTGDALRSELISVDGDSYVGYATYAQIRAYSGVSKSIRCGGRTSLYSGDGAHGEFYRDDADITSLDNDGTVLIDANGRRWKRKHNGDVNIQWFGALPDGVSDSTNAIQKAIDSGAQSVIVPPGDFKFSSITMPSRVGFTFHGVGPASKLIQTGQGIKWPTRAIQVLDGRQTIRDFQIDGTSGTGHCIDTTYVQASDILNILITNIPVGYSGLRMNGNPTDSTYAHDMRVKNFRVYSAQSCNAGIHLGSTHSDCTIDGFQMNGCFLSNYCILADNGAQTTALSNSHPYNAKINIVKLSGNNGDFGWDNVVFDNALQDLFYSTSSIRGRFTNCFFEMIAPGFSGIVFDASYNNTMYVTEFMKNTGGVSVSCVKEINGSSGNKINGGSIDNVSNYTNTFLLSGVGSYATGFQWDSAYGIIYNLTGTAQTPQNSNSVVDYGVNGAGSVSTTAFCTPLDGSLMFANIATDSSPAAGQTFTFNVRKGNTILGTGVINHGSFQVRINFSPNIGVVVGDQLSIQSVFSVASGSASPRYSLTLKG